MAFIGAFPTFTSPGVVPFGLALSFVFVIPIGLITAITGIEVTLNVIAELIGGSWAPGNALAMSFFKAYGLLVTSQAITFSNDLKLAHYTKIPPLHTFIGQMWATFVSSLIAVGVINFQLKDIKNMCTVDAPFNFTCPGINTFFTAAVFWGTISPKKLFGPGRPYNALLAAFPIGLAVPFIFYGLQRAFPRQRWLKQLHPVAIFYGGLIWAPFNFSYAWSSFIVTWVSWSYVKPRYLAFWAKYNYVLAAAFQAGIAISAIVIFFALQLPGVEIDWWGNDVVGLGCEGTTCPRLPIPDIGYFGPAPGTFT